MALNPSRSAFSSTCKALRQCRASPAAVAGRSRPFSSSPASRSDAFEDLTWSYQQQQIQQHQQQEQQPRPRWSHTPAKMKGPGFSINIVKDPRRTIWKVNDNPELLDAMYNRLLGPNGENMLPEEVKWLAVTHKSFDQGRRGFNTRLAYFGRQVLALETTRSILVGPASSETVPADPHGREPFQHPALANIDKLSTRQPQDVIDKDKMAMLAVKLGLHNVLRWKPRLPENLEGSGLTVVLNTTIFAIIGAISLQHGAEVAQRVVRDKILKRLGA